MRIAINTRFLLKGKMEGMGLFTKEVVRRMVLQHPEHEFIFFFDRPFDPSFVFASNVKPVVLWPPARHPFLFIWWFEVAVARALKRYKVAIFLSPDNFLSLRTLVKTVLVTHDLAYLHVPVSPSFFQKKYYEFFSPRFNNRADHIVAVSQFTKKDIVRQFGVSPEKISVACNGCDDTFKVLSEEDRQLVQKKFASGRPYFFYVGAIHPRKNIHRLIEAFDQFKRAGNADVKLLIAGRFAWQAGAVRSAFERSAFQKDIRFLGYVSDDDLPRLMGAALACTYVSLFEGFGIPILQAMHCGVPVITSNESSMPEVAGKAGLLVNPYSVTEIARAMHQIWSDSHLYSKLVRETYIQKEQFSWQRAKDVVYRAMLNVVSPVDP